MVSGSLRATDSLLTITAQFKILNAPDASNSTTYGPGEAGGILRSNGTSIYWNKLLETAYGGTGNTSYTQWGIVYANPATKLVNTGAGTNGALLQGKGSAAPAWKASANGAVYATAANGDLQWGTLPVGQGGTGRTTLTANAVLYGNGTSAIGMLASANGAVYATAANGALNFGTLPTGQGGTGNTSYTANRLVWTETATKFTAGYHYASSTKVGICYTSEPSYNFAVSGTSYFNGNTTHNGIDYFANGTTYYINNSGYGNLHGLNLDANLTFSNSGTDFRGINYGTMGDNDQWRIGGAATAANAGYMELATADDGNEPIYVRQYTGVFTTLKRTLTLLDANGHSTFPGRIYFSGDGLYHVGSAATYQILGIIDSGDQYGTGIRIGAGGLFVAGSGESASTIVSNLSLTAGGTETTYITSDNSIVFYPGQNGYDAAAKIEMTAGRIWTGVNGNTTRENQIGVQSGAGQIYLWSHAATSGSRGLYVPAHGTGGARGIIEANTNNYVSVRGNDTWGNQILLTSNWIGFYKDALSTGTRYGYIQCNVDRMYFRKENSTANLDYYFDFNANVYTSAHFIGTSTASSWIDGQRYNNAGFNLTNATDTGSYWPWIRQINTSSGRWFSLGNLNNQIYLISSPTSRTDNGYNCGLVWYGNDSHLVLDGGTYHQMIQMNTSNSECSIAYNGKSGETNWVVGVHGGNFGWWNGSYWVMNLQPVGRLWVGRNANDGERQIGVEHSTSGTVYMWANNGEKGIYSSTGYQTGYVIRITSGERRFYGNVTGNADSASQLYVTGNANTVYLTGVTAYESKNQTQYIYSPCYMSGGYLYAYGFYATANHYYMHYNNTNYGVVYNHGNANVSINACGGGLYVGYSNTTLINWLNGKATLDSNGVFAPAKIDIRPGTHGWVMQVGANQWGGTGIANGTADGGGNGSGNLSIASWYGIIFEDGTNWTTKSGINCRTGVYYGKGFSNTSSILVKENIKSLSEDKARQILLTRPVSFDYKKEFGGMKGQFGLVAEELEEILPELVEQPTDKKGYKHIDYTRIIPFLIKLAQSQQKEIDKLKLQINDLI